MVLLELMRPVIRGVVSARYPENGRAISGAGGFTLVELLIANVFLVLGLVASAMMVDIAISRVSDAKRLSVATNLATEMAERIRFNSPANSTSFSGAYPNRQFIYSGIVACSQTSAPTSCPGEAPGNATAVHNLTASGDYDQWRARLKGTDSAGLFILPNAVATVTSADTGTQPLGQVLITVTIAYDTGIRRPSVTLNTFVAPL